MTTLEELEFKIEEMKEKMYECVHRAISFIIQELNSEGYNFDFYTGDSTKVKDFDKGIELVFDLEMLSQPSIYFEDSDFYEHEDIILKLLRKM